MLPLNGHQACITLAAILIGALLLLSAAFAIDHYRLKAAIQTLTASAAIVQAQLSANTAEYEAKARKADSDSAATIGTLSDQLHEALSKNVQIEHARNTAIAAGTQRVYVRAHCPAAQHLPADSATASAANDAGPELDPAYRSTLSALRIGAANTAEQIKGLQAYANECYRLQGLQL